jgi:alcohol dehydrogenase class IV
LTGDFIWRDAGRTVVFRRDAVAQAAELLAGQGFEGFELISTERALAAAPGLRAAASVVHDVAPGGVPERSAELLGVARSGQLVAFGGGRIVDVAKAVASVTGARVATIPTTMSGAEMTGIHKLPAGAEDRVRALVRPALVLADPEAMTSLPEAHLRASSMNALAHGADSLYTPFANPVSKITALRGAELISSALDQAPAERDRAALALGSILCGYAIDSGMFALHHVICQTLVRFCGTPHGATNAAILPRAMRFMAPRAPAEIAEFAAAIQTTPAEIESRILDLGGNPPALGVAGADRTELPGAIDAILARPELAFAPGPPDRGELEALIESAW